MKRMFTVILAVLVITVVGVAPASASKAQKCERKLARLRGRPFPQSKCSTGSGCCTSRPAAAAVTARHSARAPAPQERTGGATASPVRSRLRTPARMTQTQRRGVATTRRAS